MLILKKDRRKEKNMYFLAKKHFVVIIFSTKSRTIDQHFVGFQVEVGVIIHELFPIWMSNDEIGVLEYENQRRIEQLRTVMEVGQDENSGHGVHRQYFRKCRGALLFQRIHLVLVGRHQQIHGQLVQFFDRAGVEESQDLLEHFR